MKIGIIDVQNSKKLSINKDLVGGLGQIWEVGNSFFSRVISYIRRKKVKLPVLSLAYIQAILKEKKIYVKYFEDLPLKNEDFDVFFFYGSMIDYQNENNFAVKLKQKFPDSKVGFIGPFPSRYPEYFKADFVIVGEPESFFLYQFYTDKNKYKRIIKTKKIIKMDDLPTPDFSGFPIKQYSYFPALNKKPVLTLQASRGCPYSCSYYCAYGAYQGSKYRKRSPEKIINDIKTLIKKHNVKSIQFRDPTFGLDKKQIGGLCDLIIDNKIKIDWGIETRMDLLNFKFIKKMADAGLKNINVGIETIDDNIAKVNKRGLDKKNHQEEIVKFCKKIGVKISAFYIFGYKGDNKETIKRLIDYSLKLNTIGARFAINTPFPGTFFYEELKKEGKIKNFNLKDYNSFCLVFEHENLNLKDLNELKEIAFIKYYFRPRYILEFLKWKIREF